MRGELLARRAFFPSRVQSRHQQCLHCKPGTSQLHNHLTCLPGTNANARVPTAIETANLTLERSRIAAWTCAPHHQQQRRRYDGEGYLLTDDHVLGQLHELSVGLRIDDGPEDEGNHSRFCV